MPMDPKELDLWNAAKADADQGFKNEQDAAVADSISKDQAQIGQAREDSASSALAAGATETDAARRGDRAAANEEFQVRARDGSKAALAGALKAVFESKDFLQETVGLGMEPGEVNPSSARQWADNTSSFLAKKSIVNGVVRGIAQFGTGFVGLGKIKALKGAPSAVGYAVDAVRAAVTGAVVFDPHEERLSNFIQQTGPGQWPFLKPVSEYLAAKPEDGKAEGRFKAAVESLTLDAVAATAFVAAVKGVRAARSGDKATQEVAQKTAEEAFTKLERNGALQEEQLAQGWERSTAGQGEALGTPATPTAEGSALGNAWTDQVHGEALPSLTAAKQGRTGDNVFGAHDPAAPKPAEGPTQDLPSLSDAQRAHQEELDINRWAESDGFVPGQTQAPGSVSPSPIGGPVKEQHTFRGEPLPKTGVAPANMAQDGTIYVGAKGSQHFELSQKHGDALRAAGGLKPGDYTWKDVGFVTPDGQFLDRKQAFDWVEANEKRVRPSENMYGERDGRPMLDAMDYREQVPNRDTQIGGTGERPTQPAEHAPNPERPTAPTLEPVPPSDTTRTAPAAAPVVTPEQVAAHLRRAQRDASALTEHGTIEAAQEAGHVFRGQEDGFIPWQKMSTPEATRAWVGQVVDEQRALMPKPISDARMNAMVAARARLFNEDPEVLKGIIKQAGEEAKTITATMETGYLLANKGFTETYALGQRIAVGNYGKFGTREAALEALRGRLQTSVEMIAAAKALSSAAGRSLRRMRGEFSAERMAALQAINVEGLDPEALAKVIASTGGDPALLAKVGQPGILRQVVDWVGGVYASNLMWGWSTQTINAVTSAAQLYLRPLEVIAGSVPRQVAGKLLGDETLRASAVAVRAQARKEMLINAAILSDGAAAAKWAFLNGDSKIAPHTIESMDVQSRAGAQPLVWREVKGLDDVVANALMASNTALHGSLRLAGTVDEMVKVIRYRAIVTAKATVEADAVPALKAGSAEYKQFIKDRVEGSFDDAGRAIDVDALAEAKASTFQQDLIKGGTEDTWGGMTSVGSAWQGLAANFPPLRLITPFVKTPSNLIRYGIKLTPGLNLLQKEYLNAIRGLKGPEEQARATGQMMMGILLASTAVQLRMNGNMTGAGPQNEQQNAQWKADGNMPYSITGTNADGTRWNFQLNRFDPIQGPVTLLADVADIYSRGGLTEQDEQGLAMSVVLALSHQFKNKMYLKSFSDFLTAMGDEKKLETLPKRYLPGFVPWSTMFANFTDDGNLHEVRTVVDGIKAKLPGYSADVPIRRDWMGDEVIAPGRFYNEQQKTGPLGKALDEMYAVTGTYLQAPNPRQGDDKQDLRDLTLESGRNAYERYSELSGHPPKGPSLREALVKLVSDPEWQALKHGRGTEDNTREFAFQKVVEDYRRRGLEALKAEDKTFREAMGKRAQDNFQAAASGKKDLRAVAGQATQQNLQGLLSTYGLTTGPAPTPPAR